MAGQRRSDVENKLKELVQKYIAVIKKAQETAKELEREQGGEGKG